MHFLIIVLALIGAGVYTDNSGFYWAAGVVGVFAALVTFFVLFVLKKATKTVSTLHDDVFSRFNRF